METVLKADIFFFIASAGVIIVSLAFLMFAYYAVKLVQEVRKLVRSVRAEIEIFREKRREAEIRMRTVQKFIKHFVGDLW